MLDDQLYLIDPNVGTATPVFDFGSIQKGGWPQLMRMTEDGQRLVTRNNLHVDPRFQLDCNTAFATGPARPHGVAFK